MITPLLVEQHFHGCYGINFNTASVDDVVYLARRILTEGVGYIFPTIVTDTIENTKRQIQIIRQAAQNQSSDMAKICGVHLEGIFLNPEKACIHNPEHFLLPTVENYKLLEDDFIRIVTLAPELVPTSSDLIGYLHNKGVKVQAGHCVGGNLAGCDGVTHLFNGMKGVVHRGSSTALAALTNDNLYTEIIADGVHVSDDALKLLFKVKPIDKIILISDCLPCTHSDIKEFDFADERIYFDGIRATSKEGTIAGSTMLLPDIIKVLGQKNMFSPEFILNPYKYHNIKPCGRLVWDNNFNIIDMEAKFENQ